MALHKAQQQTQRAEEHKHSVVEMPQRELIDVVHERTVDLIANMQLRRDHLEGVIADATEKLRQVNVVLEAADKMAQAVADGMLRDTPALVHDEVDTTRSANLIDEFDEIIRMARESTPR